MTDCNHINLIRMETPGNSATDNVMYSCQKCGEMFTANAYEIGVQYGIPKE